MHRSRGQSQHSKKLLIAGAGACGNSLYLLHSSFSSVQSLSHVQLLVTPWTAARQASLSLTNSQSLLKFMSIESVMPSNHLILCRPLLLPPPLTHSTLAVIPLFSHHCFSLFSLVGSLPHLLNKLSIQAVVYTSPSYFLYISLIAFEFQFSR